MAEEKFDSAAATFDAALSRFETLLFDTSSDDMSTVLHIAVFYGCPLEVVDYIFDAVKTHAPNRNVASALTTYNESPLHLSACCPTTSEAVITALFNYYPNAAVIKAGAKDCPGRTPLNLAVLTRSPNVETFRALHETPVLQSLLNFASLLSIDVDDEDDAPKPPLTGPLSPFKHTPKGKRISPNHKLFDYIIRPSKTSCVRLEFNRNPFSRHTHDVCDVIEAGLWRRQIKCEKYKLGVDSEDEVFNVSFKREGGKDKNSETIRVKRPPPNLDNMDELEKFIDDLATFIIIDSGVLQFTLDDIKPDLNLTRYVERAYDEWGQEISPGWPYVVDERTGESYYVEKAVYPEYVDESTMPANPDPNLTRYVSEPGMMDEWGQEIPPGVPYVIDERTKQIIWVKKAVFEEYLDEPEWQKLWDDLTKDPPTGFQKNIDDKFSEKSTDALNAAGILPWRRSRLLVVGQGRAGKTSFIRSLQRAAFQEGSQSTVGLAVHDFSNEVEDKDNEDDEVRDAGIDMQEMILTPKHGVTGSPQKGKGGKHFSFERQPSMRERAQTKLKRLSSTEQLKMLEGLQTAGDALSKLGAKYSDMGVKRKESVVVTAKQAELVKQQSKGGFRGKKLLMSNSKTGKGSSRKLQRQKSKRKKKEEEDGGESESGVTTLDSEDEEEEEEDMDEFSIDSMSIASTSTCAIEVEDDGATAHEDVILDDGDDDLDGVTLGVWDYGGQAVFQVIQHLYMPRVGVYTLVFNMEDLVSEAPEVRRKNALHYLNFWLHSIETHAVYQKEGKGISAELQYPPVLLVGTHFDKFKHLDAKEQMEIMKEINKTILHHFKGHKLGCFQRDKNTRIKNREFLYNFQEGEVDLCFFPVDNSDPDDQNMNFIRGQKGDPKGGYLLQAIKKDSLNYLNDPVPASWLEVADKFAEISANTPLLPVETPLEDGDGDESVSTVVAVMRKAGAMAGCNNNHEAERKRADFLLDYFHRMGIAVFFKDTVGMQNDVILSPQWIIDNLSYIIRDFKLHRFRRDSRAMSLKDGRSWEDLLNHGILAKSMLDYLWLGQNKVVLNYLTKLMEKLGLFVEISKDHFLVSCTVSAVFMTSDDGLDNDTVAKYLQLGKDEKPYRGIFSFPDFLPNGFYERVISQLVEDWPSGYGYDKSKKGSEQKLRAPLLLHSGAELCMGKDHKLYLSLDRDKRKINVMVEEGKAESIVTQVKQVFKAVNRHNYSGRLNFMYKGKKIKTRQTRALKPEDKKSGETEKLKGTKGKKTAEVKPAPVTPQEAMWIEFLKKDPVGLPKEVAKKYAANMMADGTTAPWSLKNMMESVDKDDFKEYLKQIGIDDFRHVMKIKAALASVPKEKPKTFAYGFFGGENLQHSDLERHKIHVELLKSHLDSTMTKPIPSLSKLLDITKGHSKTKEKILRMGMHGHVKLNSGEFTLDFPIEEGEEERPGPEEVANAIANCCAEDGGQEGQGTVECVVINACYGFEIAKLLKDNHSVPWVISWETEVDDEAAMTFSETFYFEISQSADDFEGAFKKAKRSLELRQWDMTVDPGTEEGQEQLQQIRKEKNNLSWKAAGKPVIYRPSDAWLENKKDQKKRESERLVSTGSQVDVLNKLEELDHTVREQADRVIEKVIERVDAAVNSIFKMHAMETPRTFVILPYKLERDGGGGDTLDVVAAKLDEAQTYFDNVLEIGNKAAEFVSSPFSTMKKMVWSKVTSMYGNNTKLYLYLIDERTGECVWDEGENPVYPINIEKRNKDMQKLVEKLIPAMQLGLKAMKVANTGASLARCFGIPAPKVDSKLLEKAEGWVGKNEENSTVAGYDCLQALVNEGEKEELKGKARTEKLRGSGLKEFENFLLENDGGNVYNTLLRKDDKGDGDIMWVGINSVESKGGGGGGGGEAETSLLADLAMRDADILTFLVKACNIKEDKATQIAESLKEQDVVDVEGLLAMYEDDEDVLKEVLVEAGVKVVNLSKIKKGLKKMQE
ncbi:hypothetical protein TrST_g1915 [Triparma strigata]|uniref:COR domain-containing protein n=1 Tax=Triparma strigata TaxID=1606541 RepID=A0A9W7AT07_9STRA|nr:hypothetical protein TrST_g1915 [Triparma strigata]